MTGRCRAAHASPGSTPRLAMCSSTPRSAAFPAGFVKETSQSGFFARAQCLCLWRRASDPGCRPTLIRANHMKRIWTALFILLGMGLPVLAQHVGPIFPATTLAVTTGGTWQVLFAANANRTTLWIPTELYCTAPPGPTSQGVSLRPRSPVPMCISHLPTGVAAPTTGSGPSLGAFELAACGSQVFADQYMTKQAVYVVGATTAHQFTGWQTQ